uniref:Uncharacterized protein n=1 Tax=viral metagenome TaxID=1070528 RepID=A0A6C0BM00_9ZZZZ
MTSLGGQSTGTSPTQGLLNALSQLERTYEAAVVNDVIHKRMHRPMRQVSSGNADSMLVFRRDGVGFLAHPEQLTAYFRKAGGDGQNEEGDTSDDDDMLANPHLPVFAFHISDGG